MQKFSQGIVKKGEMDDDFKKIVEKYAEKEPTPMEMDLKVRMDRVIYVLNRTLATIKVMMYLPAFLENDAEILRKYLQPHELCFILRLLSKYGSSYNTDQCKNEELIRYTEVLEYININRTHGKFNKYTFAQDPFSNPRISQMIHILYNNNCIRQLVKSGNLKKSDKSLAGFLDTMEKLKNVAKDKIYETGEEEDVKNKELRQAYKHTVLVVASIKELQARLDKQRKQLGEQMNKKMAISSTYNKRKEKIKEDFQIRVESILTESEKEMMNRTVISEEKQSHLAEEAKRITKEFELALEEHLASEKISRSKRFKAETQLQNWLIKFDQDIGERQAEYETYKMRYDEEKADMEALQELFEDQEEEYTILMKEKAEEEERIFNEMAFHFLQSRSARIIQRTWRAYIQRKKAKRKGRKGKGKGGKKSAA